MNGEVFSKCFAKKSSSGFYLKRSELDPKKYRLFSYQISNARYFYDDLAELLTKKRDQTGPQPIIVGITFFGFFTKSKVAVKERKHKSSCGLQVVLFV